MTQGYLYIASGKRCLEQSIVSVQSLRRVDKNAHVTLLTDKDYNSDVFDSIISQEMDCSLLDKVRYIYDNSPYEKTFFVDADTYFYGNCNKLYDLLDYFDVCIAAAPGESEISLKGNILFGYNAYNTGCIVFRKNPNTQYLFREWLRIYNERLEQGLCEKYINPKETDQASFNIALLYSNVKIYVLPNVFNARLPFFINLKGEVKIVHGWDRDYEKIRKKINATTVQRCWDPVRQRCIYYKENKLISDIKGALRRVCNCVCLTKE